MKRGLKHKIKKLEVHSDERGWLLELLKANELREPIKQIYIASIKPGHVRGNHYHSKRIEWFFIVTGEAKLTLQDIKTKEKISFKFSPREPKIMTIFPYIAHAVKNTGKEMVYLVAAQNTIYDFENPDAFRWEPR